MAVNISNSRNALIASPIDAKSINYYVDEETGNYIIETIAKYLTRVEFEYRSSGVVVAIHLPKTGLTPSFSYATTEDFSAGLDDFDVKQYAFISGLADENFVELTASSNDISEVLAGDVDGVNKIFTTSKPYKPGNIQIYVNGLKEIFFSETDINEITLDFAPLNVGFTDRIEAIFKPK